MAKRKLSLFDQYKVYWITFFTIVAFHATRTTWSYAKPYFLEEDVSISRNFFGNMDMIFMFSYGAGFFILAPYGDKMNPKIYLFISCISTGLAFGGIGMLGAQKGQNEFIFYFLMCINGLAQSMSIPGTMAVMEKWFRTNQRGFVMGFWAGNSNIGNIVGYEFGTFCTDGLNLNWSYSVYASSIFLFIMGVIILLFLQVRPTSQSFLTETQQLSQQYSKYDEISYNSEDVNKSIQILSLKDLSKVKGLFSYVISFVCIKSSYYGILFWLASYLKTMGLDSISARIGQSYDIGQILGGILIGYITDKYLNHKRAIILPAFLILASGFFLYITTLKNNSLPYFISLFACGIFLGGPYNVIIGTITQDMVNQIYQS